MKIVISGGSGYIGRELEKYYQALGFDVVILGRKHFKRKVHDFKELLIGADAIIHLSGAGIFRRWTSSYKTELLRSRIDPLEKIYTSMKLIKERPSLLLSASAVGIYDYSDEVHTEDRNTKGKGFMPELVDEWEKAALKLEALEDMRVVLMRFGVVLGTQAPAFKKMRKIFSWGMGGRIGKGTQAFPCIHIEDLNDLTSFLMQRKDIHGPVNFVAPEIVTNKEFNKKFGKAFHRPSFFVTPRWVLYLMKGKASQLVTKGAKVYPERLLKVGYQFKYPDRDSILKSLSGKKTD